MATLVRRGTVRASTTTTSTAAAAVAAAASTTTDAVPPDVVTPLSGSGVTRALRDAVLVLDRHELVLALGKFAVVHNTQRQELLVVGGQQPPPAATQLLHAPRRAAPHAHGLSSGGGELGEISALALDGRRQHLAVCRVAMAAGGGSAGGGATVSIHSLKSHAGHQQQRGAKLKTMRFGAAERFCSTAMSTDGKLVCCQSADASWTLVVWDWQRERQVAVSDVHCPVSRVRFNAIDMAQLSTSGGNQLKLWTLSEYTLKSFASFKSGDETRRRLASYADHVWLPDDCLVALLDDGSVQLIINGELLQTVQALALGARAHCIVPQNNGEAGVMVGGSDGAVTSLRIVTKLMKAGEKEMHLQRRMAMANAQHIYGMSVDATGTLLVCCTEAFYGSYDLSNLCLLLGEDESLALTPLASTPFVSHIVAHSLSAASRRPCFAALARLPTDTFVLLVWNQLDGHECFVVHPLEPHAPPLSLDMHPTGTELAVAFPTKVVVFFLLQDAVKVGFELAAKHVSHVAYSASGSHLITAQSATRTISVYRSLSRFQREPELLATFQGAEESVERIGWSINDRSFFYADGCEKLQLRHCTLLANDGGELEEAITVHSATAALGKFRACVGFASCRLQRDSHDYVLFAVEKDVPVTVRVAGGATLLADDGGRKHLGTSSQLRAWLNGNLVRDALVTGPEIGLAIPHDVTAIAPGNGNTLLVGTALGLVLILYWKQGRLNPDGSRNVLVMGSLRQVDLHAAPVTGLVYSRTTKALLSNDASGVVFVSCIKRGGDADPIEQRRQLAIANSSGVNFDDDVGFNDPLQTFVNVCQPDEIAVYDRNSIELRKLKLMDIEGELQQVKLENELLTKQQSEQRRRLEDQLKGELHRYQALSESRQSALQSEMESRLHSSQEDRESAIALLRHDAQLARDQYVASADKLHCECERLRQQLTSAHETIEDLKLGSEERHNQLRVEFDTKLRVAARASEQEHHRLALELQDTKRQLCEALVQQDQDQLTQLALLSSNIDHEKARASDQMSHIQGKMAALHQEVKMLLAALNQKDHELHVLQDKHDRGVGELGAVKDQLRREREHSQALLKEKHDLAVAAHEQKLVRDNLQRLNNVHRSQIELLQKNLLPKERELEQMQLHLNQLHSVNQEVVVQANLSDRLRKESGAKAKQNEADVQETQDRLEHVRNSIVVLQEELGELVKQSAVQDKIAVVGEIMRIHKRITRQIDVLQARDGRVEEVSAELHRQNRFLLKNKQHLRHQGEIAHKEKHKLVSALSFQNGTLMHEINALRKQNKELNRMVRGRMKQGGEEGAGEGIDRVTFGEAAEEGEEDEVDSRQVVSTTSTTATASRGSLRPGSASSHGPTRLQQIARRTSIRPKSAAATRSAGVGGTRR